MSSTTFSQTGSNLSATVAPTSISSPAARALLVGAVAGPFYVVSSTIQMLTREGFDLTRHPLSQLATGSLGWIQMATFALAGLGIVALAVGMRRVITSGPGRRVLPVAVAVFGFGLLVAGIFPMDAQQGFPLGTPDGPVSATSWHASIHVAAAIGAYLGLAVACLVACVRAARRRAVRAAVAHGLTTLVMLLPTSPEHATIQLALTGLIGFVWTTTQALTLRRTHL